MPRWSLSTQQLRARNREIVAASCQGEATQAIADRHGLTKRQVNYILERAGVSPPAGRKSFWPDSPPEHLGQLRYLRRCGLSPEDAWAAVKREHGL